MIDILIEDDRWVEMAFEAIATEATKAVLDHHSIPANVAEIAILACDDARIATLNTEFRGKPTPTNVLSWPTEDLAPEKDGDAPVKPTEAQDGSRDLGNVAIAYDTCKREADEQNKALANHVAHLIVHGVLHLLGYDHIRDGDATRMEALEVKILGRLGIPDPY